MLENNSREEKTGLLAITYTKNNGSTLGVEFSATSDSTATAIIAACTSTMGTEAGRLVSSSSSSNNERSRDEGGDGMEGRIAVLESDVSRIKADIIEIKADQKTLISGSSEVKSDIKLSLQQLTEINEKISNKASKEHVDLKIAEVKNWILGVLLLSIAMPIIFFVLNLYLRKP